MFGSSIAAGGGMIVSARAILSKRWIKPKKQVFLIIFLLRANCCSTWNRIRYILGSRWGVHAGERDPCACPQTCSLTLWPVRTSLWHFSGQYQITRQVSESCLKIYFSQLSWFFPAFSFVVDLQFYWDLLLSCCWIPAPAPAIWAVLSFAATSDHQLSFWPIAH